MDDSMKNSLQRAFVFSKAACSRPNERRFFEEHKFTLTILPMVNRRAGGSFSAAASLGFLALAKRKRVDDSICVTGKVNRKGKIVCVLNIEAKVTAAVRAGKAKVIIPHGNLADFLKIPNIKGKIQRRTVRKVNDLSKFLLN
ncbi:hypothetical protein niasHT_024226 [Heterodera trifolii]|uniref:Lon proteolytic domain-containing protein n=1 Tax=Heterodera trifolii TaxID=157864 RepID=A0ABD2JMD0_9BILA